jgi:phosphate-selective porin OprO/OprP
LQAKKTLLDSQRKSVVNRRPSGLVRFSYKLSFCAGRQFSDLSPRAIGVQTFLHARFGLRLWFRQIMVGEENMRSLTAFFVLLVGFMAPGALAHAQGTQPASKTDGSASTGATKEEVNQLRSEVAAQHKTIEELKAMVQQLVAAKTPATDEPSAHVKPVAETGSPDMSVQPVIGAGSNGVRLVNTVLVQPEPGMEAAIINQAKPAAEPKKDAPLTAGWNGEHFFIKSPDGQFSISPYGYVDIDYRAYKGDGAPSDTFVVRRARFGFQGNYGSHFDYAILTDANSTTGAIVRDVYLNVRIRPEFQFQAGQFKEPFAQETGIGATNLDFVERGLQSLLYPSAVTAFRSPGMVIHGDIGGGVMQYWVGAFNGRGGVTANVTNEPDFVGRIRLYPWRKTKNEWLRQFALGGSIDHARSRGLSNDVSFSGTLPEATYTFFPQLRINGPIERYEGEFTYLKGPYALRGEYVQIQEQRYGVGSETPGGLGFLTLPGIGAKAWNIGTTYLLTGEKRPENGTPRVNHPLFGPDTPGGKGRGWGAWELGVRYSGIQANAPSANFLNIFTPGFVPGYDYHTDQFSFGVNWYLNYWVKYQFNVDIDRLKQPSVTGQEPQNFYVLLQELQFRF